MISPSGAAIAWTASNARNTAGQGLVLSQPAKHRERPMGCADPGMITFVVGTLFLLPPPSWYEIVVPVTGTLAAFTFSVGTISLLAFRKAGVTGPANRLPGMAVIAPLAFVVSALVIYWVGSPDPTKTIPIVVAGLVWSR